MSVYVITGKLGSGKTLVCVGRIHEYLKRGNRVATNLDINMNELSDRPDSSAYVERLPDYPTSESLKLLGEGHAGCDESNNGLLVLDECGTWLNSRGWNGDKDRQAMLDWMLHSRKLNWDVLLIVQDLQIIDKQVRLALCEHLVVCRRLDRLPIPFVSGLLSLIGIKFRMPKVHLAIVRYGQERESPIVERWLYRGRRFYTSYDTRQIFNPNYQDGLFCVLPKRFTPHVQNTRLFSLTNAVKYPLIALCLILEGLQIHRREDWTTNHLKSLTGVSVNLPLASNATAP